MQFALLVQAAPLSGVHQSAQAFVRSLYEQGHEVYRLFFYQDAVLVANQQAESDDAVRETWEGLQRAHGFEMDVCVAASTRRGIGGDIVSPAFEIVGLGQMVEAMEVADRTVTFG